MGRGRISVAVATYNGEKYIREQMDSILENLEPKDEIIISDDGSSDHTLTILEEEYKRTSPNIRLLKGPGRGIRQNIANAIGRCKGEYVFLSDQDDVWARDKVEKVMDCLLKNGCRLVVHDARVMDGFCNEVLMPSFFDYRGSKPGVWQNLLKNRYMGCCMAFEASLIPYILPIPDTIPMHDQWIGIVNDMLNGHTVFLKEPLINYRRHEANVSDFSHNTFPVMLKNRVVLLSELIKRKQSWKKNIYDKY